MRLCFIGSGMEDANERLRGIEIGAVAEVLRTRYDTLVFGGSSDGFMGSFASAFAERGGRLTAVLPGWLRDMDLVHPRAEVALVSTLAERKHLMFEEIDAVLCYPGGIGTWDELFDLLARRSIDQQVHALPPCPPIYLYDWEQFYAPILLQLEVALEAGLIHPESVAMLQRFGSAEELRGILGEFPGRLTRLRPYHVLRRGQAGLIHSGGDVALTDETGRGNRAAWDRIAGMLDSPYLSDPFIRASFDRFCASLAAGASVLDVGCGEGTVSAALVTRGFRVTSLDQSPRMLAIAAGNARGASFVEGDVTDLPFGAEFDAVTAAHVLVCLDDHHVQLAGQAMVGVLRPGSLAWVTVNYHDREDGGYTGGPMYVLGEWMYSRKLSESQVAAAFAPLRVIDATRAEVVSRFGLEPVLAVTLG